LNKNLKVIYLNDKSFVSKLDLYAYRACGITIYNAENYLDIETINNKEAVNSIIFSCDSIIIKPIQLVQYLKKTVSLKDIPLVITGIKISPEIQKEIRKHDNIIFIEQPIPKDFFIEKIKKHINMPYRKKERINFSMPEVIKIRTKDQLMKGSIENISTTGLLIKTGHSKSSEKDVIEITMMIPGEKLSSHVTCIIIRKEQKEKYTYLAVKYKNLEQKIKESLDSYMTAHSTELKKVKFYL
tara:strand:+ start:2742 stop:3464 length:723 start_codon:yes stop_codon:yes gene_type:complete